MIRQEIVRDKNYNIIKEIDIGCDGVILREAKFIYEYRDESGILKFKSPTKSENNTIDDYHFLSLFLHTKITYKKHKGELVFYIQTNSNYTNERIRYCLKDNLVWIPYYIGEYFTKLRYGNIDNIIMYDIRYEYTRLYLTEMFTKHFLMKEINIGLEGPF